MAILVLAEHRNNKLRKAAREVVSEGRALADELGEVLFAVLIGHKISALADEVNKYGPEEIYLADDPGLGVYNTETYAQVLEHLVEQLKPRLVLMAHSAMAKDLAPRVAQRVGAGLLTDCVDILRDDEDLSFVRPIYAGKCLVRMKIRTPSQFVTLRPNSFSAVERPGSAEIKAFEISLEMPRAKSMGVEMLEGEGPDLTEADIVVSGGRGLGDGDGFVLVKELAKMLGAAVGASRSAVDAGWASHQMQVGQTGKVVSPKLYIALGISGAIQHIAGMGTSKCIVAVNKDREANIFRLADYGIVEDLYKVIPVMIDQLRNTQAGSRSPKVM